MVASGAGVSRGWIGKNGPFDDIIYHIWSQSNDRSSSMPKIYVSQKRDGEFNCAFFSLSVTRLRIGVQTQSQLVRLSCKPQVSETS